MNRFWTLVACVVLIQFIIVSSVQTLHANDMQTVTPIAAENNTYTHTVSPTAVTDTPAEVEQTTALTATTTPTETNGTPSEINEDGDLSAPQVIGGEISSDVTKIGGYARIRMTYMKNGSANTQSCNGVLIDSEWVLTAAHCMYPEGVNITNQPANVQVELGCFRDTGTYVCSSGSLMLYGQPRQPKIVARQIVVHDQLTLVNGIPQPAYGVALIRLSTPAQTGAGVSVWSIAQSTNNPISESSPYIVSLGNRGLHATVTPTRTLTASRTPLTPSKTLTPITRTVTKTLTRTATAIPKGIDTADVRIASISLINDASCTLPGFSGATLWCANATAQGNELCYGDVGAPLVSKVNGQLAVFGISLPKVQFGGAHNCVIGMQSAMVDVTAPVIRTWIMNTIRTSSPRGLNTSLGGSAGFGGEQLAPSDNDMTQLNVSSVFPNGIRIGNTTSTILSVNANGVVALGDVKKLDKIVNVATYTGVPLFLVYGADADPSLGSITAPVGGKSSGANRVWVARDTTNGVVTITWDDVRPAKLFAIQYIGNTFQVQFRRENTNGVRVTYRYGMMQWTFSETMCSQSACMGAGNRITYAQVGFVSGQSRGVGNLMHPASGNDKLLRNLVTHEYVIRDGVIGPERPTVTPTATATMTRTRTRTFTNTATRSRTATRTPTFTLSPTVTNTPFTHGLVDGLLAWYPLNGIRQTGSTLPVQASTTMGMAQYFDGVNDFHQTTIDLANKSFTIAFWAEFEWVNGYQLVIGGGNNPTANQGLMIGGINNTTNNSTQFYCGFYGSDLYYTLPNTFNRNSWHHYACTYDRSNGIRQIWIDGVMVASDLAISPLQTTSHFWIGRSPWNNAYFKGYLRDVVVYDRFLSKDDITRIKDRVTYGILQTTPIPTHQCRWFDGAGNVHEYEINHDLLTWDQAKTAAESRVRGGQKGYLATITSAVESECIAQLVQIYGIGYPWVGGSDAQIEGTWKWMTGPEKGMNINKTTGYENWGGPQPDNCCGGEHYLNLIYSGGGWNDSQALYKDKSIIEYTYPKAQLQTVTRTPLAMTSGSTWEFDTLSGNAAASSASANTNATFFCGTNHHVTMVCPTSGKENGTTFVRFTGNQFMSSQAAISETSNVVRIRFRTSQVQDGSVGIYGVVKDFKLNAYNAFDREIFLTRNGRVCSRLYRGGQGTEIICTVARYDDGQWHTIERSYGGTAGIHLLRVDFERIAGRFVASLFDWESGAIIGHSATDENGSIPLPFRGDIDYISTGLAP